MCSCVWREKLAKISQLKMINGAFSTTLDSASGKWKGRNLKVFLCAFLYQKNDRSHLTQIYAIMKYYLALIHLHPNAFSSLFLHTSELETSFWNTPTPSPLTALNTTLQVATPKRTGVCVRRGENGGGAGVSQTDFLKKKI